MNAPIRRPRLKTPVVSLPIEPAKQPTPKPTATVLRRVRAVDNTAVRQEDAEAAPVAPEPPTSTLTLNKNGQPVTYLEPYPPSKPTLLHHRVTHDEKTGVITSRIHLSWLRKEGNQLQVLIPLVADLKRVGVPIEGTVAISTVTHGTLEMTTDSGDAVYTWTPDK